MKYPSNWKLSALAALVIMLAPAFGRATSSDLFLTVSAGDRAYAQLAQLEKAGLLSGNDSAKVLTRFEMAQRILKAQTKYDEIVLAQADDIPPPPADSDIAAPTTAPSAPAAVLPVAAAPSAVAPPAASAPTLPTPAPVKKVDLAQAEKNLHSLTEAYDFELKAVKDQVKEIQDRAAAVDASQYEILKKLNGIVEYPSVSIHGLGRAFAFSQQFYGDYSGVQFPNPSRREGFGYLDLIPTGAISKQVRWDALLRFGTNFEPDASKDFLFFRRITMELNPEWFHATLGDFSESYTPLTLWNRNNLDLMYMPEMIERKDRELKYESFFDKTPDWPFRGLRIGTDLMWPDSPLVEKWNVSIFANMIANGFNADSKNASFFGPTTFTDWIFAGKTRLESKKWYVSNISVQINLDAQGVILDEPLYTNAPGALYDKFDPVTWAHQYLVGSWTPEFRLGFGGDFYFGTKMDLAFASYQDDKKDDQKTISDYAMFGGPYFQMGESTLRFNFLNVGPNYFSPLAQVRQDKINGLADMQTYNPDSPDLWQAPLHSQYFLSNIPRPSGLFSFYDRSQDNTFPYGMATPNRQGFGIDLDVKALVKKALKIKGSAYFVQEISGNFVADVSQTAMTVLDATPLVAQPMRTFTYVNIGPSLNLGPLLNWDRDIEIGANIRFEQTDSAVGDLTSTNLLGGIKVGVLPSWDLAVAYGMRNVSGTEVGYLGTLYARYTYLYDNTDLGTYGQVNVQGTVQSLRFSSVFKVNKNSNFYVDYDLTQGNFRPTLLQTGELDNQFMELTYEILF